MKTPKIADADDGRAYQRRPSRAPLAARAIVLAQLQGGPADDGERHAPETQQAAPDVQSPRQRPEHHADGQRPPRRQRPKASRRTVFSGSRTHAAILQLPARAASIRLHLGAMRSKILKRLGLTSDWTRNCVWQGSLWRWDSGSCRPSFSLRGPPGLGRYDGASVGGVYGGVYGGLENGSLASWFVVLGPYGLYLLFKVLRVWWRASARLA